MGEHWCQLRLPQLQLSHTALLTEQLGPVPSRDTHELVDTARVELEVRRDVVHDAIERRPRVVLRLVLLSAEAH